MTEEMKAKMEELNKAQIGAAFDAMLKYGVDEVGDEALSEMIYDAVTYLFTAAVELMEEDIKLAMEALEGSCKFDEAEGTNNFSRSEPERQRYDSLKKTLTTLKEKYGEGE